MTENKILSWFKRIFGKKKPEPHTERPTFLKKRPLTSVPIRVPKAGSQAIRKGYGKFMKHGRQHSTYRKSVKAKKQPEEGEE